jgi:hypothetical protein
MPGQVSPPQDKLLLFTRYPVPGRSKPHLIAALGAKGAAEYQRSLTELTLRQVREHASPREAELIIHYSGGSEAEFRAWLGEQCQYREHAKGDFGARLTAAFAAALGDAAVGPTRAVALCLDNPEADPRVIDQAFDLLAERDVVFGMPSDGGLFLVGLSQAAPGLFADIPWRTETVQAALLARADALGLSVGLTQAPMPLLEAG